MKSLILLSRYGCQRCEDLEDALHERFSGRYVLDWRDVDRHVTWREQYGLQIPVLLTQNEKFLCAGELDSGIVEEYLSEEAGPV